MGERPKYQLIYSLYIYYAEAASVVCTFKT